MPKQTCWANNVINVLRKHRGDNANFHQENNTKILGSSTEFLSFVREYLSEGNICSIGYLHEIYLDICRSNDIDIDNVKVFSRRELKLFLFEEVPEIVFSVPKRKNDFERVSLAYRVSL